MKKGFVFTLISILFVSVILIAFLIQVTNVTRVKTEESRVKVETINAFLKSIKNTHVNSAIKVSATRAFGAMVECIKAQKGEEKSENQEKKLYDEPIKVLNSIIRNGDLSEVGNDEKNDKKNDCDKDGTDPDGKPKSLIKNYMTVDGELLTLTNALNDLVIAADQIGLILEFSPGGSDPNNYEISISQSDPWNVDIAIPLKIVLKTQDEKIKWIIDRYDAVAEIPVTGRRDSLRAAFKDQDLTILQWNPSLTGFNDMLNNNKFYDPIAQGKSLPIKPPSFLERFDKQDYSKGKGNYGIESIFDPQEEELPRKFPTWIDYLQYGGQKDNIEDCDDAIPPDSDYTGLKLDKDHKDNVYPC